MTHTIEEIREAKAALCKEIAKKIEVFEKEYDVKIDYVGYNSSYFEEIGKMMFDSVQMRHSAEFTISIDI